MSERLEKFIKDKRSEFDDTEPPVNIWERIENQLEEQKKALPGRGRVVKLSLIMRIAAMALIVFTAGILLLSYQKKAASDISSISPGMASQQVHYASLIEAKRSELQRIEKEDPRLYNEFAAEIKKMDVNYQKLKSDLPTSPNQEKTVKAMIRNLQTQIQVLNQQLNIIQQIRQFKKEGNNETQSI